MADGFLAIIKQFGWGKVALIVQEENLLTIVSSSILQTQLLGNLKTPSNKLTISFLSVQKWT